MKKICLLSLAWLLAACNSGGDDLQTRTGNIQPPPVSGGSGASCAPDGLEAMNPPESPLFALDPLGPISDVTCNWQHYQPADSFCVQLDAPEFTPGSTGPLTDGSEPACAFSGFGPDDGNLFKVEVATPLLCTGCRRLFIDFSRIPADQPEAGLFYAQGHAYYRPMSFNPTYTVDPIAHSPNTKNFTNDKLVAPEGTPLEQVIGALDLHFMTYVTDTFRFAHTAIQGPYYIGPWYVNREGERIHGVYLDVDVMSAQDFGDPNLNAIRYMAGYNSGEATCLGNGLPEGMMDDANFLYGGCFDRMGGSRVMIDPYAN